jgi:16S rRNA C1402 (ribose-2'-O) methylase RsmI
MGRMIAARRVTTNREFVADVADAGKTGVNDPGYR